MKMDEKQRQLERQVVADPSDREAAFRLESMQIRAGMLSASDEGSGVVTTLLRQHVIISTEARNLRGNRPFSTGDVVEGVIVAVYTPSVASRQATESSMSRA